MHACKGAVLFSAYLGTYYNWRVWVCLGRSRDQFVTSVCLSVSQSVSSVFSPKEYVQTTIFFRTGPILGFSHKISSVLTALRCLSLSLLSSSCPTFAPILCSLFPTLFAVCYFCSVSSSVSLSLTNVFFFV